MANLGENRCAFFPKRKDPTAHQIQNVAFDQTLYTWMLLMTHTQPPPTPAGGQLFRLAKECSSCSLTLCRGKKTLPQHPHFLWLVDFRVLRLTVDMPARALQCLLCLVFRASVRTAGLKTFR